MVGLRVNSIARLHKIAALIPQRLALQHDGLITSKTAPSAASNDINHTDYIAYTDCAMVSGISDRCSGHPVD